MTQPHILLVDASGIAHRAYHVGSNRFRSDGLPTWAIENFISILWRLLGEASADQPTHSACIFDHPSKTFRHKLFPAYKTNRPARDMELTVQLPWLRHAAEAMGMTSVEAEGFEGDDVLTTLAARAVAAGMRVSLVSSDKDLLQNVADGKVAVYDPVARIRMMEADVREKLGVEPCQVPDYQALAGDAVDNIPGVEGVGPKSAAMMIRQFHNIEGVVNAAKARHSYILAGQRIRLRDAMDDLRLYRMLATLVRDVPLDVTLDELELRPVMREHVYKLLDKLEARARFDAIFATEPKLDRVVPALEDDPFDWWREEVLASGQRAPAEPQCGFYMTRLVSGGPRVPARIWRDPEMCPVTGEKTGQEVLRCEVNGRRKDAVIEWARLSRNVEPLETFLFETADRDWVTRYSPNDPKATPDKPIDPMTAPLPVFNSPPARRVRKRAKHERSSDTGPRA